MVLLVVFLSYSILHFTHVFFDTLNTLPLLSLFSAGNSSVIRVWDMNREQCVSTIPSGCDTCVTAIGSDWNSHVGGGEGVVLCGYGDGSLRLFDARLPVSVASCLFSSPFFALSFFFFSDSIYS